MIKKITILIVILSLITTQSYGIFNKETILEKIKDLKNMWLSCRYLFVADAEEKTEKDYGQKKRNPEETENTRWNTTNVIDEPNVFTVEKARKKFIKKSIEGLVIDRHSCKQCKKDAKTAGLYDRNEISITSKPEYYISPEAILGNFFDLILQSAKKDKFAGKDWIKILLEGEGLNINRFLIVLSEFHPEMRDEIKRTTNHWLKYKFIRCQKEKRYYWETCEI